MSDFKVRISYKNKNMETVVEKEYNFIDYVSIISNDLKKILTIVEEAFSYFNDGKPKDQWSEESLNKFGVIRHKLLDQANAIQRMPENLTYKNIHANEINLSEYIANVLK